MAQTSTREEWTDKHVEKEREREPLDEWIWLKFILIHLVVARSLALYLCIWLCLSALQIEKQESTMHTASHKAADSWFKRHDKESTAESNGMLSMYGWDVFYLWSTCVFDSFFTLSFRILAVYIVIVVWSENHRPHYMLALWFYHLFIYTHEHKHNEVSKITSIYSFTSLHQSSLYLINEINISSMQIHLFWNINLIDRNNIFIFISM